MSRVELTVPVDVDAPAEAVWETVTDWAGQSEWMLGTRVQVNGGGPGHFVGARLRAVTGVGPLGFTDTKRARPSAPTGCVVSPAVVSSVMVTTAPATAAPEGS